MKIRELSISILLYALLFSLLTVSVRAQSPEGQAYTVQSDDWLIKIAEKSYGDPQAYPAIIAATNAKAAEDPGFAVINDANIITAGQKLWLPASKFVGIYQASQPAASSPGRETVLMLHLDGSAELSIDYLNGEAPIGEVGTWQDNGDGMAAVTLTGRTDGAIYEAPNRFTFRLDGNTLTAVEYDQTLYGSAGLTLTRQLMPSSGGSAAGAASAPGGAIIIQPEDAPGIYKAILPAASSPGIDSTLYLNVDNTVRLVEDFLNGDPAIVEVGNWQLDQSSIRVTLTGQEGRPYDTPTLINFHLSGHVLATRSDEDAYGLAGRRYWRFDALAFGELPVPYSAAEADQIWAGAGLAGIYKGFLPAAACCGQDITLFLNADNTVTFKTDYLNGEMAVVERGTWQAAESSRVEINLDGSSSPLSLEWVDGVLKTAAGEDTYGSIGLSLYRLEVVAKNAGLPLVTGTVSYLERIALPPQAGITVQLVDISQADPSAGVLARQIITANGRQSPFAFALSYDPAAIEPSHTYVVQARIEVDGQLRFINITRYPVLTQGAPATADLILNSAGELITPSGGDCANVPAIAAQDAPPEQSSYRPYEQGDPIGSSILETTMTVEGQAADQWREAALNSLGYCAGGYTPERVTIYTPAPGQTIVVVFARVSGDDAIVAEEVRLDLAGQGNNQWQVEWAGVRRQCARGGNTTDLIAALCP